MQDANDALIIHQNFVLAHRIRTERGFTAFNQDWNYNEHTVAQEIRRRLQEDGKITTNPSNQ